MTNDEVFLVPANRDDHWIVSYCIHISPGNEVPVYTHASVSKADERGPQTKWVDITETTYGQVAAMPPIAGHQVIPYLVFHLDQIKAWLVAAHEAECLSDRVRYLTEAISANIAPDLHVVKDDK